MRLVRFPPKNLHKDRPVYKDIDMSIQSTNSNDAWKNTLNLAQKLNVNVRAIFIWRKNKGASNPGEKGMLEWNPKGTP